VYTIAKEHKKEIAHQTEIAQESRKRNANANASLEERVSVSEFRVYGFRALGFTVKMSSSGSRF
jgi:hypothetical protein